MILQRFLGSPSSASASRILTTGLVAACLVGLGMEVAPVSDERTSLVPDEFRTEFSLPVPADVQVVLRSIEPKRWRSLLVLDLEPDDPPDWADTIIVARIRPIPGVLLGQATAPCELPEGGSRPADWWSFGNRLDVRMSAYASVVEAVETARAINASENHTRSSGGVDATPTTRPASVADSVSSIPVGVVGSR